MGLLLHRTESDELPQLWNAVTGEMSLVGPRPCLFNQIQLVSERVSRMVFNARPSITGLAQVSSIDKSTPKLLAETDVRILKELIASTYFEYIFISVGEKGFGDGVRKK